MKISFEYLSESHFPLLLKWLESSHVKLWWDKRVKYTEDLIKEKYTSYVEGYKLENGIKKKIDAFIICVNGKPIGYIQSYRACDFLRNFPIDELKEFLGSVDIFIGEKEYLGKGLGTKVLKLFFENFYEHHYQYIMVSPDPKNIAAIKSYEKAGFVAAEEFLTQEAAWMFKAVVNKKLIKKFFNLYKEGFNNKDAEQIVSFFAYPCFMRVGGGSSFLDKNNLIDIISNVLRNWGLKNFKEGFFKVLEINYFTSQIIQVHLSWEFKDNNDEVFTSFESVYLLSNRQDEGLKIFSVVNLIV